MEWTNLVTYLADKSGNCPHCGIGVQFTGGQSYDYKNIHCIVSIKIVAVICPHCHQWILTLLTGQLNGEMITFNEDSKTYVIWPLYG